MRRKALGQKQAFTLPEIMLVVGLIWDVCRDHGSWFHTEPQIVTRTADRERRSRDRRGDQGCAMEVGAVDGASVDLTAAGQYTKQGNTNTTDLLGNACGIGFVGSSQAVVSATTKSTLSAVNIDWGPY